MALRALARRVDDVLHPVGQLDVLLFYGLMADANASYLDDRELATKVSLPNGPTLLKRGSDLDPITADDVRSAVDEEFLILRDRIPHLDDARATITPTQELVWQYFLPRTYCELHYATNFERGGAGIDRIFFDIDRGPETSLEQVLAVTRAFVEFLDTDELVSDIVDSMAISFTGNSFHVDLLLAAAAPPEFYAEEVFTSEGEELDTITDRGVRAIRDAVDVPVVGGHERKPDVINIDPSQTPAGKLHRVPLGSIHLADAETIDGVSVPVTSAELFEPEVLSRVTSYSPRMVVDSLDELQAKLP